MHIYILECVLVCLCILGSVYRNDNDEDEDDGGSDAESSDAVGLGLAAAREGL